MPILFSYDDLRIAYPNSSSFFSLVSRYMKQGKIKQIKKGLYALVDPSTNEIYATRFQIASRLFNDSYFSYHDLFLCFSILPANCTTSRNLSVNGP